MDSSKNFLNDNSEVEGKHFSSTLDVGIKALSNIWSHSLLRCARVRMRIRVSVVYSLVASKPMMRHGGDDN